jgi:hypothetical protein
MSDEEKEMLPVAEAEEVKEEGLVKSTKKKKKKSKAKKQGIAVKEVDYWNTPVDVDPIAVESNSKEFEKGTLKEYEFWKDQPVPQFSRSIVGVTSRTRDLLVVADEITTKNEPIQASIPVGQVQKEAYALNAVLEWCEVDIFNAGEMDELYTLLNQNYVEDAGCTFRFDYSREFLLW